MMNKEELRGCVEVAFGYGKDLLVMWNDYCMQQIRLRSANERRVEEFRQQHINEMDVRKTLRFKVQRDANYERWRSSPDYDPKKDRRINGGL